MIDRGFAVQPPVCLAEYQSGFLFPQDQPWGVQGVEATKHITDNERCLTEAHEWYLSELRARTK